MAIIEEPLVEGAYVALLDNLQIRPKMDTTVPSVGLFKNGETFAVFQVFPEVNGIVWGRISSNTNGLPSRFVGLRVNNHPKAQLLKRFADEDQRDLVSALRELTADIRKLTDVIRSKS